MIIILAAMAEKNRAIGKNEKLPWNLPEEIDFFKRITAGHVLVMGKKTYHRIGRLPGRTTVLVSRTLKPDGCLWANCFQDGLEEAQFEANRAQPRKLVFLVGGHQIFQEGLDFADKIFLTTVKGDFEGDVFFPEIPEETFILDSITPHNDYDIRIYSRREGFHYGSGNDTSKATPEVPG